MKTGSKVGAILSSDENEVYFLGFGTLLEDEVPSKDSIGLGKILSELGMKNPTILLDNGKKVYGCECWWSSREKIEDILMSSEKGGKKIHTIDIEKSRKDSKYAW